MRYTGNGRRGIWRRLVEAGLYLIIFMGLVLIALSIGFAFGAQVIKP